MKPVDLHSYHDFTDLFSTCRSPSKGKPLPGGWRLFLEGNAYVVKLMGWRTNDTNVFTVTPNNVVTFNISSEDLVSRSHSMVTILYKIIPLLMQRKRKDTYQLGKAWVNSSSWNDWCSIDASSPEYFQGIQFDLTTQVCLNPKPDLLDSFIPEVRKQWLRDVKRFKKGLKARAKVGALQGYIQEVEKEKAADTSWRYTANLPKWTDPKFTQHVLESMRTEQYPPDLLKLMVQTVSTGWNNVQVTDKMVLDNVDRVFDMHSLHYRKAYGVFG